MTNQTVIQASGIQLFSVVEKVRAWLIGNNTPENSIFFQRNGLPYYLDNQRHLRLLDEDTAATLLSQGIRWVEKKNNKTIQTFPPVRAIRAVLADPIGFLDLSGGIVSSPFFSQNGSLIRRDGYHCESKSYLHSLLSDDERIQSFNDTPTKSEVETAVSFISEKVLGGFRFESEADKTNAVGLLVLPYCKQLISGMTPLHLIEAPTPGTGKSLLSEIIVRTYQGEAADSISYPDDNSSSSQAEFKKECDTALLESRLIVTIENVNGVLQGGFFAKLVSQPRHSIRRFHTQTSADVYNNGIWIANGNNPRVSDEIARRIVKIRLDSKTECPELRNDFDPERAGVDKMLLWVSRNRGKIINSCLTLIQSWLTSSKPSVEEVAPAKGGFESWREVIGGILYNAGIKGFLQNQETVRKDPLYEEWIEFVDAWSDAARRSLCVGGVWMQHPLRPSDLNLFAEEQQLLPITRGDGTPQSQTTRLGRMLNKYLGRVFLNRQLKSKEDKRNHSTLYFLEATSVEARPEEASAQIEKTVTQPQIIFTSLAHPVPIEMSSEAVASVKDRLIEYVTRGENFTRSKDGHEFHFEYEDEGTGERIKLTLASKPVEEIKLE